MPLVMQYWADLQSVHGLRCYGNTMEMRGRAHRYSARLTARRTQCHALRIKTPLAGDKIDAPAACAVPFRPYCGGLQREREMLASTCLYWLCASLQLSLYNVIKELSCALTGNTADGPRF